VLSLSIFVTAVQTSSSRSSVEEDQRWDAAHEMQVQDQEVRMKGKRKNWELAKEGATAPLTVRSHSFHSDNAIDFFNATGGCFIVLDVKLGEMAVAYEGGYARMFGESEADIGEAWCDEMRLR
jgi:hypothetical protein